jgi:hypothetical protein
MPNHSITFVKSIGDKNVVMNVDNIEDVTDNDMSDNEDD